MANVAIYVIIAINAMLSLSSTFTNALVILAILKTPTLHTPSNVLLCSLAVSDFGVGFVVQPLFIIFLISGYVPQQAMKFVGVLLSGASLLTMTAIAVDRYLALVLHLRYRTVVTVRRVSFATCFLWFLSLSAYILYQFLGQKANSILIALAVLLCLGISTYCYIQIYCIVRRHRRQIMDQTLSIARQFSSVSLPTTRQGKSVTTMFYIHSLFVFCILPWQIGIAVFLKLGPRPEIFMLFCCSWTILFVNSAVNPYLYCWRMQSISLAIRSLLTSQRSTVHPMLSMRNTATNIQSRGSYLHSER